MAYTPVQFTKDGVTEVANSSGEEATFLWEGWVPTGAPVPPSTLEDLVGPKVAEVQRATFGALVGGNDWAGVQDFTGATVLGISGGTGGGATVASVNGQTGVVVLDADDIGDGSTKVGMTPAERTKLNGIATGATANATDAQLRDRTTHTGTQTSATLSDLTEVVQDIVAALIVAGTNTTVSYNDAAGTFTINSTASGGTTDPEVVRDTIGGALVAGAGIQVTINDAGDTITIASTAVLPTRAINAGTGLTGGGDLSADRSLAVAYGATAGTAVQGNDTRVVADQAAGTASIRTLGTGAQQAMAGNDSRVVGAAPLTGVEGVKVHDLTAGGGTRPTGYARVRWIGGTTRPTNMAVGDIWERDA